MPEDGRFASQRRQGDRLSLSLKYTHTKLDQNAHGLLHATYQTFLVVWLNIIAVDAQDGGVNIWMEFYTCDQNCIQFGSMELYTQWSYIGWSYIRWSSILAIELYSSSRWSYILAIELMVILLYVQVLEEEQNEEEHAPVSDYYSLFNIVYILCVHCTLYSLTSAHTPKKNILKYIEIGSKYRERRQLVNRTS